MTLNWQISNKQLTSIETLLKLPPKWDSLEITPQNGLFNLRLKIWLHVLITLWKFSSLRKSALFFPKFLVFTIDSETFSCFREEIFASETDVFQFSPVHRQRGSFSGSFRIKNRFYCNGQFGIIGLGLAYDNYFMIFSLKNAETWKKFS